MSDGYDEIIYVCTVPEHKALESQNPLQEAYDALCEEQAETLRDLALAQERIEELEKALAAAQSRVTIPYLRPTQETGPNDA